MHHRLAAPIPSGAMPAIVVPAISYTVPIKHLRLLYDVAQSVGGAKDRIRRDDGRISTRG